MPGGPGVAGADQEGIMKGDPLMKRTRLLLPMLAAVLFLCSCEKSNVVKIAAPAVYDTALTVDGEEHSYQKYEAPGTSFFLKAPSDFKYLRGHDRSFIACRISAVCVL